MENRQAQERKKVGRSDGALGTDLREAIAAGGAMCIEWSGAETLDLSACRTPPRRPAEPLLPSLARSQFRDQIAYRLREPGAVAHGNGAPALVMSH
jgi:hypothetical protein